MSPPLQDSQSRVLAESLRFWMPETGMSMLCSHIHGTSKAAASTLTGRDTVLGLVLSASKTSAEGSGQDHLYPLWSRQDWCRTAGAVYSHQPLFPLYPLFLRYVFRTKIRGWSWAKDFRICSAYRSHKHAGRIEKVQALGSENLFCFVKFWAYYWLIRQHSFTCCRQINRFK